MKSAKNIFLYRLFFCVACALGILTCFGIYFIQINKKIPDHIYMNENQQVVVSMGIPASGEIVREDDNDTKLQAKQVAMQSGKADLSRPVTFIAGKTGHYTLKISLFGFITYGKVEVDVVDEKYVYPGGFQIGMYLHMNGALVVGTEPVTTQDGKTVNPWENLLAKGDYIVSVNGASVNEKEVLSEAVQNSEGNALTLGIRRNQQDMQVSVTPVYNGENQYCLGLWVKDDAQGIGTVTYIQEDNTFAALGHGISDSNTGNISEINMGRVYRTHVMSIVKGKNGTPGELLGAIEYKQYNQIGVIEKNQYNGIYGEISGEVKKDYELSSVKVGYSSQVHEGNASIRFYYKNEFHEYPIEIESLTNGSEKNITFKVTSAELLDLTNGIVQGMSGCPILQDGNIIGAVTHVFIDDSTKGYGIYIEEMING